MATSNTKLTQEQKQKLKTFKNMNPKVVFVDNGQVTIAYSDDGKFVRFATSIMSNEEEKFRRNVGQYVAAFRIGRPNLAILPSDMFRYFLQNEGFYSKAERDSLTEH